MQKSQNQQGGQDSKQTPGSSSSKQQSQSGGGRDQQGSPKSDQDRNLQQGSDNSNRSNKQR